MKQMADNLQHCHKNEVHVHQYKTHLISEGTYIGINTIISCKHFQSLQS